MNRPRFNTPKPSPGFVYFQTAPNPADTPEFLAFNGPNESPQHNKMNSFQSRSPHQQMFSPHFTSSPVQFKRGNRSRNNWNHRGSSNQQHNRQSSNYSNSSPSANRSYPNNSWNSSTSSYNSRNQSWKRNSDGDVKLNISSYIHPSFIEDPWANLVSNIERTWAETEAIENLKLEKEACESEAGRTMNTTNCSQNETDSKNSGSSSENSSGDSSDNDSDTSSESDT